MNRLFTLVFQMFLLMCSWQTARAAGQYLAKSSAEQSKEHQGEPAFTVIPSVITIITKSRGKLLKKSVSLSVSRGSFPVAAPLLCVVQWPSLNGSLSLLIRHHHTKTQSGTPMGRWWHHTPDSAINGTGTLLEGMEVVIFMSELFIVDQKVNVEKNSDKRLYFQTFA